MMRFPFRRKPGETPQPVPEPAAGFLFAFDVPPLEAGLEREIAVGSLSGVAPGDIGAHLLLVVDSEGCLRITGAACEHMAVAMLTHAASLISRQALTGHPHETED